MARPKPVELPVTNATRPFNEKGEESAIPSGSVIIVKSNSSVLSIELHLHDLCRLEKIHDKSYEGEHPDHKDFGSLCNSGIALVLSMRAGSKSGGLGSSFAGSTGSWNFTTTGQFSGGSNLVLG